MANSYVVRRTSLVLAASGKPRVVPGTQNLFCRCQMNMNYVWKPAAEVFNLSFFPNAVQESVCVIGRRLDLG